MSDNEIGKGKSSKLPLILLVVVIVIGAAAAAYFFLIQPGQTPVNTDNLILNLDGLTLRPSDLPGNYSTEYNTRYSNEALINAVGAAEGKSYAIDTNRIDGWQVYYSRIGAGQIAPEFYFNRVEIFETNQGARLALSKDYFFAYTDEDKIPDEWLDKSCTYGQKCILFSYRDIKVAAGTATVRIDLAFSHKNVLVWLYVTGLEGEATEQHLFDAAEIIIERIDALN
jgi:hypothetical protein